MGVGLQRAASQDDTWKTSLVFDYQTPAFPVELFIQMVEFQVSKSDYESCAASQRALDLMSDLAPATSDWKAKHSCDITSWEKMKSYLLRDFGKEDGMCSVTDKVILFESLHQGVGESAQTFRARINFVVSAIMTGKYVLESDCMDDSPWTSLLFYLGLSDQGKKTLLWDCLDRHCLQDCIQLLDSTNCDNELQVKTERDIKLESENDVNDGPVTCDVTLEHQQSSVKAKSRKVKTNLKRDTLIDIQCQICQETFDKKTDLRRHCESVHSGRKSKCPVCQKEVKDRASLKHHMSRAHQDPKVPFRMIKTSRSFGRINTQTADGSSPPNTNLKNIFTQIIKPGGGGGTKTVYVCALCQEKVTGRTEFTRHSKTAHDGKVAKCDVCPFAAKSIHHVARHRFSIHNLVTDGFEPIYCDREGCGYKTLDADKLPLHVATVHEKLRPWKCEVCPMSFGTKSCLKLHVERVHMGLRPYACDREGCGATYSSATELRHHVAKAHSAEAGGGDGHLCTECGATYTLEATLKKHVRRVHRKEKNVACPQCPKTFFSKCRLNAHTRSVHQLDKKYVCTTCDRGFANNGDLRHHVAVFHLKVKSYRCKICNSFFTKGSSLTYHIGVQHLGFQALEAKLARNRHLARHHEAFEHIKNTPVPPAAESFK